MQNIMQSMNAKYNAYSAKKDPSATKGPLLLENWRCPAMDCELFKILFKNANQIFLFSASYGHSVCPQVESCSRWEDDAMLTFLDKCSYQQHYDSAMSSKA